MENELASAKFLLEPKISRLRSLLESKFSSFKFSILSFLKLSPSFGKAFSFSEGFAYILRQLELSYFSSDSLNQYRRFFDFVAGTGSLSEKEAVSPLLGFSPTFGASNSLSFSFEAQPSGGPQ